MDGYLSSSQLSVVYRNEVMQRAGFWETLPLGQRKQRSKLLLSMMYLLAYSALRVNVVCATSCNRRILQWGTILLPTGSDDRQEF